jgi:leader peptidase (prepilin peptidase)/N-methyltransferase
MQWIVMAIGIIIGSFLNVCIYRIPRGESVSLPPSHCPICNHRIRWYENIPIFSYVFLLRGRCSNCNSKVSIQYPLVEFLTGILFYIFYIKFGYTFLTLKYLLMIPLLIVAIWVDFIHYYIPDRISFSIFILGLLGSFVTIGIERSVLGAGVFSLFFLLLYGFGESFGKEIMGFGDVKLSLGIGSIIGYYSLYEVFIFLNIAFVTGAIVGIILIFLKLKTRKDIIPFGPYIAIAGLVIAYISY